MAWWALIAKAAKAAGTAGKAVGTAVSTAAGGKVGGIGKSLVDAGTKAARTVAADKLNYIGNVSKSAGDLAGKVFEKKNIASAQGVPKEIGGTAWGGGSGGGAPQNSLQNFGDRVNRMSSSVRGGLGESTLQTTSADRARAQASMVGKPDITSPTGEQSVGQFFKRGELEPVQEVENKQEADTSALFEPKPQEPDRTFQYDPRAARQNYL